MVKSVFTLELWCVKWMTTAPLKGKKLKFYKIISDKIQKTQFCALFLAQDWSRTTFKASNYNYTAVNNDEKQGR